MNKDIKIFTTNIEPQALNQIHELANTGVFDGVPIRIMPDVHAGAACVIGFTAPYTDKIIPNIVGVDIGCGMLCIKLNVKDIDLVEFDKWVHEQVPAGKNVGAYSDEAYALIQQLRCFNGLKELDWLASSIGSLGGGNHFIEVDEDKEGYKYLVIHTGSRNLGKQVADYYTTVAEKACKRKDTAAIIKELKEQGSEREIEQTLKSLQFPKIPKQFSYLSGKDALDYLHDMQRCCIFADKNREAIAKKLLAYFGKNVVEYSFTTRHNYIDGQYIRKGAISAQRGEQVLIPLNMRDGCILGVGKGNPDWNYSAPHGAGRILSRGAAKKLVTIDEFKNTMEGVYSTTVNEFTIDESPFAYKPAQEIIQLLEPTVEIVDIIKPIYNFKAGE